MNWSVLCIQQVLVVGGDDGEHPTWCDSWNSWGYELVIFVILLPLAKSLIINKQRSKMLRLLLLMSLFNLPYPEELPEIHFLVLSLFLNTSIGNGDRQCAGHYSISVQRPIGYF